MSESYCCDVEFENPCDIEPFRSEPLARRGEIEGGCTRVQGVPVLTVTAVSTQNPMNRLRRLWEQAQMTGDDGRELLGDQDPDFPHEELAKLYEYLNRTHWVVPVLREGELKVLMQASIKLCQKGLDTKSEACQRFLREELTVSFTKFFTYEAVLIWRLEIQNAEWLLKLCVVKLSQDSLPLLNLLAIVLDPNCKFHVFNGVRFSKTVPSGTQLLDDELFARPSDPRTPRGWLVNLVNRFGTLNGFQALLDRFTNGTSLPLPVIAALLRPFGLCLDVLTTHVIQKYFMPIVELVPKIFDGFTVAELKKLSKTEANYNIFREIIKALKSLVSRIPGQGETVDALEVFRLNLIHRIIISERETVDLSHPWPASDVVFLVEHKKIHANKGVLSLSSPVFRAIIFRCFKEKSESIPLPEKKYNDILLLFTICHTLSHDVSSFLIADIFKILLPLAREYRMSCVKKRCNQWSWMPVYRNRLEQLSAIKISTGVDLSHSWHGSDVMFVVEQKRIYASKGVLSFSSPVYDAMLFGDFKEKMSECITLPGKKYNDVLLLFSICHTLPHDVPNFLTDDGVTILLPLAREYQVQRVLKLCEEHLLSKPPSVLNLIIAREFGFKHLEETCINYLKGTPLDQQKQEEGFQELTTDSCAKFLID